MHGGKSPNTPLTCGKKWEYCPLPSTDTNTTTGCSMLQCAVIFFLGNICLTFHSHDRISSYTQSRKERFVEMYSDETEYLQKKLIDYLTSLKKHATSAAGRAADKDIPGKPEIYFEKGYPMMPKVSVDNVVKKDDLEDLLRCYLRKHYRKSEIIFQCRTIK